MGGRTLTDQLQLDSMLEKVRPYLRPYLRLLAQAHLGDQLKRKSMLRISSSRLSLKSIGIAKNFVVPAKLSLSLG